MYIFLYTSFYLLFLYILLIGLFIIGFVKIKTFVLKEIYSELKSKKYLTVIIPFKNEDDNLKQLIKNLKNQSLNSKYFEVILINDNSSDNSYNIVSEEIKDIKNFKLLNLPNNITGKKNAIIEGIRLSSTNIIVTSDADCIHQKKWLETIFNYYLKFKPKMIIAPVLMTGKSFFQKIQSLEFLSLTASTAGATGINRPIMCSGANLIYEKSAFYEFNDALNNNEISGDDVFLMHKIKKKYPKQIHYLKSNNAVVYTEAEKSIKSFFKQRLRWASKSKSYKDFDTIFSSIIVFFTNLIIVCLLIFSTFKDGLFFYVLLFWGAKTLIDAVILLISGVYFKQKKILFLIPILSLTYPFYISFTAILSFFTKRVSWK